MRLSLGWGLGDWGHEAEMQLTLGYEAAAAEHNAYSRLWGAIMASNTGLGCSWLWDGVQGWGSRSVLRLALGWAVPAVK